MHELTSISAVSWEDGVTGVTQCPIPSNGGIYTYKFDTNGQLSFGPFDLSLTAKDCPRRPPPPSMFLRTDCAFATWNKDSGLFVSFFVASFSLINSACDPQRRLHSGVSTKLTFLTPFVAVFFYHCLAKPVVCDGNQGTSVMTHPWACKFLFSSHHQNLMADGINGPMIIHSPRDPLKRSIDFDHDVVLMMADWYHNTSSDIVQEMLSEAGYFGTPAAPGANCALINGVGQWNCSLATTTQQCNQVTSPPGFTVTAGQRIRFRLINAGVHAMFFFSVDEHMLNITEADSTGIYGPSDFRHIWLHNGQRYSVIVQTKEEDVDRNFYMRATMNSDCWAWVPNDIQDTALGILRLAHDDARPENVSKARPDTQGWPQDFPQECIDIDPSLMVPILKSTVPASVVGSGTFQAGFGFQLINNTAEHLTREEAVRLAKEAHHDSSRDPNLRGKKKYVTISHRAKHYRDRSDGSAEDLHDVCRVPATFHGKGGGYQENSSSRHAAVDTGQEKNRQHNPQRFGGRKSPAGITRLAGPPPTPAGTIGKYFVNNVSWTTFPYQPVLHDLTPGGVGTINGSRVANVIFPTAEWYDLYLVNVDAAGSHPYHLHAMDMHIVAYGRGFPTPEKLSKIKYSTENPLRRDTVVVPSASFVVVRLNADIPGAWIMVLLIRIL
ncbi:hypothetical protein PSTT_11370 [Puccinia striiformis]|uniref:Plastocyanin-like domain-containing protein n=1 Tax=Puccinia striiformis TaxID=27350 RepID=A0A2S4V0Q6_9BASI|nr:hypothetical protein PSTT_11370 [Puccinia striiformis]